jgi:hypothetical protein
MLSCIAGHQSVGDERGARAIFKVGYSVDILAVGRRSHLGAKQGAGRIQELRVCNLSLVHGMPFYDNSHQSRRISQLGPSCKKKMKNNGSKLNCKN